MARIQEDICRALRANRKWTGRPGLGWGRRREGMSLSRPVGLGRAGCEGEGGIESRDQGGGSGRF